MLKVSEKVATPFPPLYPYGCYLLPWKPNYRSDLDQKLMQLYTHPHDVSDEISDLLAGETSCLKVLTYGRTHGRRLDWYSIKSPCEPSVQVS